MPSQKIPFVKMHGNGNDFVLIDEFKEILIPEKEKSDFVKAICHRNFGVGADGVLFVQLSEKADARFRYFNSDGSEAEMCGNGIRCFCRYLVEEGYAGEEVRVETLAGILKLTVNRDGWWVKVDMGKPKFEASEIPAEGEGEFKKKMRVIDREFEVFAANTGVPHAVIFLESLDFDIVPYGREIRFSPLFPEGTNVNFARIIDEHNIQVRTYERGVESETLSCGTGSVAVAAIAVRHGLAKNPVTIHTRGGVLIIELESGVEGDRAYMTGTASRVFEGFINTGELRI